MLKAYERTAVDAAAARDARAEIEAFHADYCNLLDTGDLEHWPEYFTEDCFYIVTARENVDANYRVGLIYCEGRAMIRDRAFAIKHTQMFAPRYLQHMVSNILVLGVDGGTIRARSNYLVLQTLVEGPTTILQAGRYFDTFVRSGGRLLIHERHCVYDTTLIANDLVYPI